jgi:hypothetical protein
MVFSTPLDHNLALHPPTRVLATHGKVGVPLDGFVWRIMKSMNSRFRDKDFHFLGCILYQKRLFVRDGCRESKNLRNFYLSIFIISNNLRVSYIKTFDMLNTENSAQSGIL